MGQIKSEKVDPLIRIQEEIKEVVRREEEHRQLITGSSSLSPSEYDMHNENGLASNNDNQIDNDSTNSLSISPIPHSSLNNCEGSLSLPSLGLSEIGINTKDSIDDDSGISASPSPINGTSATCQAEPLKPSKEQRYIGPNCYTITPEPPRQMIITNTVQVTPAIHNRQRLFTFNPANKGVMQRFIASRGKLQLSNNKIANNKIYLNTKTAATLLNTNGSGNSNIPNPTMGTLSSPLHSTLASDILTPTIVLPTVTMTPPHIERDAEGRVIRRGYVPAEIKIQKEIKDLKAREHELKKRNKFRQSTSDLLAAIGNDTDDEDSEVEHCLGPRQLRSAKSVSELCYTTQLNNSISPRATPSPDFDVKKAVCGTMRPAMSLAQLCDLPPEEAPSSHRLIEEWENRIQMNAARNASALSNEE